MDNMSRGLLAAVGFFLVISGFYMMKSAYKDLRQLETYRFCMAQPGGSEKTCKEIALTK